MTLVNPPPTIRIPKQFLEDPETRSFFEQLRTIQFQLWQRTGGGTDSVEASLDHVNLANIGTNTHPQLDTHLVDTSIHTEDSLLAHLAGTETFTGTKAFDEIIDSAKGISFPATQIPSADPNTQDDYEEDDFQVTLAPGTSGTITINTSLDTLAFTKLGRVCHVQGQITVTSVSSPIGSLTMSGLPFTTATLTEDADTLRVPVMALTLVSDPNGFKQGFVTAGNTTMTIAKLDNSNFSQEIQANTILAFNFSYITA